ncbi:MAG: hypothetical protein RSC76_04700, partial [Oscillospiraceae bacterium]
EIHKLSGEHEFFREAPIKKRGALENLAACEELHKDTLNVDQLLGEWAKQAAEFKEKTEKYHIYS